VQKIVVALIVAVALGLTVLSLQRVSDSYSTRQTTTDTVNAPEPLLVDPAPYLAAFPLTPPDIPPVTGSRPVDRALEKALAPLRKGDYAAAATALDGLLLDHPGEPQAQLYLGIARLFQDEPQNALELLRPLEFSAPPDVAAEAAWYSLVGIARLRDPSGVESEARALCASGRPTSSRACAALEALGRRK
jgi:hypothetical protein